MDDPMKTPSVRLILTCLGLSLMGLVILAGCGSATSGCPPDCLGAKSWGADWSGMDWHEAQLIEANLRKILIGRSNLQNADLSGSLMAGAGLEQSNLTDTQLIGANLTHASFNGADLTRTNLSAADLSGADMTRVTLISANLRGALLRETRLVNADLNRQNMSGSNLTGANLVGANLSRVKLMGSTLSRANLDGANLKSADLSGSWINLGRLVGADLSGASLNGASLIGAELTGANLRGANLSGAVLVGAELRGSDLRGANLRGAQLLATPDLLDKANQSDPTLTQMSEAQWQKLALGNANLNGVKYDDQTIWSEGYTPPAAAVRVGADGELAQTGDAGPADRITVAGASTVVPLAQDLADLYITLNPQAWIDITAGGSSLGVKNAGEGLANIGMSSRLLEPAEVEQYPDLQVIKIAVDCIAVVVNSDVTVTGLTTDQVRAIFTGQMTNWQQVGGADAPIEVVARTNDTIFEVFTTDVLGAGAKLTDRAVVVPSHAAMRTQVAITPHAIGFLPIGQVDTSVRALPINGVRPTLETLRDGAYPILRPLFMLVKGQPTGLTQAWLDYILGPDGQAAVVKGGLAAVK